VAWPIPLEQPVMRTTVESGERVMGGAPVKES
jgi:hypothetical protein